MTDRITYPASWDQSDRDALDAMFVEACANRLWFFHGSLAVGPMWFSPDELETAQRSGRFVWGATNWRLRHPFECLAEAETAVRNATVERDAIAKRIEALA